jgi:CheY-like chemotaxis protein
MAAPVSEITARRPRALVVDDSQIARYILSGQLKKLGFGVEVADSAEAALRQLAGPVPDVVFLDYLLPGIDGLETVSRLRGQTRTATLPVVMYTSQDGDEFAERAQAVGADDIYVKTADERRLATILGKLALLPERTRAAVSSAAVLPVAGRGPQPTTASPRRRALSGKDLSRLLERSLEAHHAKLHQELLSEFAILERYEERMRRDLFSRVDRLSGLMKRRFDDSLRQDHRDRQRRRRRRGFAAISVAASLLLASVMSVLVAWHTGQRAVALEETAASTLQAVEQNTEALVLLQREDGYSITERCRIAGLRDPVDGHTRANPDRNDRRLILYYNCGARFRPRRQQPFVKRLRSAACPTQREQVGTMARQDVSEPCRRFAT